ncbi:MAG TPA: lysylphosphatidylglycerol synthase domain-containing protein, partial [Candidatus Saccharimonadales bacterium]|nr:lysylphosphatidylglycerol synthase domain-containing protein [Candidatus Saccharimonadales bacterium]
MLQLLKSPRFRVWAGRLVPVVFYTLLLIFLALYLRSIDFSKLADLTLNWWYLALASVLALSKNFVGTFTWFVILRSLGARDLHLQRPLIYVYAKAWLGRYIPGTAPWILGKIYFASQHGISKQKLAVSSLLEGGLQIVTMLVFSLALLVFDSRLDVLGDGFKVLMLAVAAVGIVVLTPAIYNRLVNVAYKFMRGKRIDAENQATRKTVFQGATLYLADAIINGLSLFFIAKAVDPSLAYSNIIFAMGAGSLAG